MRNDTHLSVGEVQRDVLKGRDWLLLLLLALSALVQSMLGLLVEGIGWGWFSWHVARVQRNSLDRMKEQRRTCKRPARFHYFPRSCTACVYLCDGGQQRRHSGRKLLGQTPALVTTRRQSERADGSRPSPWGAVGQAEGGVDGRVTE